ncbi:MAG: alpha/beta hydrolase [Candidatus Staskawiczbacteria bacterium]|nr:alpha/beta hydrolase [Candidatus Staskawiczbacteria bacterium]
MEVNINGVKTNYVSTGQGTPFIILHGWGSASDRWIVEAEIIAKKGFKVIVPDLPGFGESDKLDTPWRVNDYLKWLEDFLNELKIENFYLLGYSFGGALAAKVAIKYPQRVEKLFLVASAVIRKKTTQKDVSAGLAKFIKLFQFLPFYPFFRKAVYKFIIRKSDYVYTEGIMKETYLNVISDDISYKLSFIKIPTVVIWGDKDQSVPVEDAHTIHGKIKNSKLVIIPGADHLLHKKLPELLAEKVCNEL